MATVTDENNNLINDADVILEIIGQGTIEPAKGLSIGDAEVSKKHANFIINNGNAFANDILFLIEEIEKRVKKTFGIKLKLEIEILGEK